MRRKEGRGKDVDSVKRMAAGELRIREESGGNVQAMNPGRKWENAQATNPGRKRGNAQATNPARSRRAGS